MIIYSVTDKEFANYGRVLDIDCTDIIERAEKIDLPDEGSMYLPTHEELEKTEIKAFFENEVYGEMPIQVGYCCGHSNYLNALEWHKSPEINIAVTDFVLILGNTFELEDGKYNSGKCKIFRVKKGQCIEVYASTMHFCPCEVSKDGFGCIVILPEGTNVPLDNEPRDKVLFRKNKWLLAHIENKALIEKGVVAGVYGENYKIEY